MNASILSCGDELTLGQRVDTNSAWLSQQLAAVGCNVICHITVPDDQRFLEMAIREAGQQSDLVLITGGIGPTADDLTRQALAVVMRQELILNDVWLHRLEDFFRARGREMPPSNRIQAMIPTGATLIENGFGTAGGVDAMLQLERPVPGHTPRKHPCRVFAMPGVPKEMKAMFAQAVLPFVQANSKGQVIVSRALHTFGLGESSVGERLGDLMKRGSNPSVGTNVSEGIVTLRVNSSASSVAAAKEALEKTCAACREKLGSLIYGEDEQTLHQVVAKLLVEKEKKVTTAESCTGGLLAKYLTDISGSSAYFGMGFVTYSNKMKYERLGVSTEIINAYGAVSEPVVSAMAKNAKRLAGADFALSISGIAGPDGGSATKPVGTVCIGFAFDDQVTSKTYAFIGDREMIRDRAAKQALNTLRYHLLGEAPPA